MFDAAAHAASRSNAPFLAITLARFSVGTFCGTRVTRTRALPILARLPKILSASGKKVRSPPANRVGAGLGATPRLWPRQRGLAPAGRHRIAESVSPRDEVRSAGHRVTPPRLHPLPVANHHTTRCLLTPLVTCANPPRLRRASPFRHAIAHRGIARRNTEFLPPAAASSLPRSASSKA